MFSCEKNECKLPVKYPKNTFEIPKEVIEELRKQQNSTLKVTQPRKMTCQQ